MPRERIYLAWQTHHHASTRKELSHKPYRMSCAPLVHHVFSRLRDGWISEEIGCRLPHDFPADPRMRVSPETLSAWIYGQGCRERQLWQYLPRGHKKRRKRSGRKVHSDRIRWRVSIHDRLSTRGIRQHCWVRPLRGNTHQRGVPIQVSVCGKDSCHYRVSTLAENWTRNAL